MWLGPNAMSTWDWFSCSVKLTQRLPECISKGPTFHSSAFRFVAFLSASVRGPKWHCGGCSTHRAPAMAIKSQGLDIKWFENNVFIYLMLTLKNDLKMIAYTSFCSLINNLWYVDLVWFNYIYIWLYHIYMACQLNSPGQTGQNSTICTIAKYLFQPWHEKRNMLCEWMVRCR
jgi:hypothetical protein